VVLPAAAGDQMGVTILSEQVEPPPLTPEGRPTAPTGVDVQRVHVTRTDVAGWFTLDSLPAGVRRLVAVPDDRGLASIERRITVPVAGSVIVPDLLLQRSPRIEGHVVDSRGRPVAGAVVQVRSAARPGAAVTDENGRFLLEGLPASEQEVLVSRPGYRSIRASLAARTPGPLRVRLEPIGGTAEAQGSR